MTIKYINCTITQAEACPGELYTEQGSLLRHHHLASRDGRETKILDVPEVVAMEHPQRPPSRILAEVVKHHTVEEVTEVATFLVFGNRARVSSLEEIQNFSGATRPS